MKIQFRRKVKDVLGRDLSDGDLGWACCFALASANTASVPADRKFTRGVLAQRIMGTKGPLDLTAEEVAEVKAAVGEFYSAALVAPIWQALERP